MSSTNNSNADEGTQMLVAGALTHPVNVSKLPSKGLNIKLMPNAKVREGLAAQCNIVSISKFSAHLNVKSWHKDGVRVSGPLKAELEQLCVTTLEPVSERIDIEINALYVPETSKLAKPKVSAETQELVIEADGDDAPELFEAPFLDVGAVAAEFFALSLNPYPKSPNAIEGSQTVVPESEQLDDDDKENPFAVLEKLRDKL